MTRPSAAAPLAALSPLRHGPGDPTIRLRPTGAVRATLTPEGPGTLQLDWSGDRLDAQGWGDGADWLLRRAGELVGLLDPGHRFEHAHPAVLRAQRHHPHLRLGASGTPYHDLLPIVLGQRVTAAEAVTQWNRLVRAIGAAAPGPFDDLHLPPEPSTLLAQPSWWFHRLGVEQQRARTLRVVADSARHLATWSVGTAAEAAPLLASLPGIGPWSAGHVLASAWGCPDAVPLGDFHLPNMVVHALTGRPRGTDAEMLALLEPYRGQRGRVVRLLEFDGQRAPALGPRRRIEPMARR